MIESKLELDKKEQLIYCTASGTPIKDEALLIEYAMRSSAKHYDYKLIMDLRDVKPKNISVVDLEFWFKDHFDTIDPSLKYVQTAFIYHQDSEQFFRFMTLSWTKSGIPTKVFSEYGRALNWLKDSNHD